MPEQQFRAEDLLVPFGAGSPPDGYLLNLFCCKPDRASLLAAEGYLLGESGSSSPRSAATGAGESGIGAAHHWRRTIAALPYGTQVAEFWEQTMAAGNNAEVDRALALYAVSRDRSLPPGERFGTLEAGLGLLRTACEREALHLRPLSLARMARDYGARSLAVSTLGQLGNAILRTRQVYTGEPFLAACERFDHLPPRDSIGNWVLASVLEECEKLSAFSSFYTGVSVRRRLEIVRDLGFGSPEMARRLNLLDRRFSLN